MREIEITLNGRTLKGFVKKVKGELWVHLNGRTYTYQPEVSAAKKKAHGGTHDRVSAPMPGKITQILVKPGDTVTAGQTVIVMEAMKMEYSLKAHHAAKIETVDCSIGIQVALGQTLVNLGPVGEG